MDLELFWGLRGSRGFSGGLGGGRSAWNSPGFPFLWASRGCGVRTKADRDGRGATDAAGAEGRLGSGALGHSQERGQRQFREWGQGCGQNEDRDTVQTGTGAWPRMRTGIWMGIGALSRLGQQCGWKRGMGMGTGTQPKSGAGDGVSATAEIRSAVAQLGTGSRARLGPMALNGTGSGDGDTDGDGGGGAGMGTWERSAVRNGAGSGDGAVMER